LSWWEKEYGVKDAIAEWDYVKRGRGVEGNRVKTKKRNG
jgi:hypothetical protein